MTKYQFQNGDFHHGLIKIRRLVLDDLDGTNALGLDVLALDHLAKRSLAEQIEDLIPDQSDQIGSWKKNVLLAFLVAQNIVDVQNVVVILVIKAFILDGRRRLGQTAAWL